MKSLPSALGVGSGGRELGKRLSDCLGWPYYDREIISAVARRNALDEGYVEDALEQGDFRGRPTDHRPHLCLSPLPCPMTPAAASGAAAASSGPGRPRDCIIVGPQRGPDPAEHRPLKLFVYADLESRLRRVPGAQLRRRAFHSPRAGAEAPGRWTSTGPGTTPCSPTCPGGDGRGITCA